MLSERAADIGPGGSESIDITDPRDVDVICGRGGAALRHPGNQTYRTLVNLNKGLYITCLKTEKLKISRSIVAAIREQRGRFLERDGNKGTWIDIGDKKAIEKTSQALREGQPKLRQKMVEEGVPTAATGISLEHQFGNGIYNPTGNGLPNPSLVATAAYTDALQMQQIASMQPQMHQAQHTMMQPQQQALMPTNELSQTPSNLTNQDLMIIQSLSLKANSNLPQSPPAQASRSSPPTTAGSNTPNRTIDRRTLFAKMKYSRRASGGHAQRSEGSLGAEGMPDIQMVDFNISLMSNLAGQRPKRRDSLSNYSDYGRKDENMAVGSRRSSMSGVGSRRSSMSGLSRVSDSSEVNSIISDLSKKIGNVSTRSIAMSEISGIEEGFHEDLEESFDLGSTIPPSVETHMDFAE